jgi:hypothetical protein
MKVSSAAADITAYSHIRVQPLNSAKGATFCGSRLSPVPELIARALRCGRGHQQRVTHADDASILINAAATFAFAEHTHRKLYSWWVLLGLSERMCCPLSRSGNLVACGQRS